MPLDIGSDQDLLETLNHPRIQDPGPTLKQQLPTTKDLFDTDDENVTHGSKEASEADDGDDDDDELIVGLNRLDLEEDTKGDQESYVAKGPTRGRDYIRYHGSSCPYERPNDLSRTNDPNPSGVVTYIDQLGTENSLDSYPGIPGFSVEEDFHDPLQLDCIDVAFCSEETGSRIGFKDSSSGLVFITSSLSIDIDEHRKQIGVHVEERAIPDRFCPEKMDITTMDIFLELVPDQGRLIKVKAKVESSFDEFGGISWILPDQFLKLEPFLGESGISYLLHGIPPEKVKQAIAKAEKLSQNELFKPFGPNDDSFLSSLCVEDDDPDNRAYIFAVVKRLLGSKDPKVRKSVFRPSKDNRTPLIYASLTNKARVARFLAEIYYDLGEDITTLGSQSILYLLVRKGDEVADTLETLLQMEFRDGSKVFNSQIRNSHGEMAIHMASKVDQCQIRVIQLLFLNNKDCMVEKTNEGMLPLHYACQYSSDPSLLAFLLCYNKAIINVARDDGCTPLHLVAARSDVKEISHSAPSASLVPLPEDAQRRMIKLLLENGADKTIPNESYLPMDLVNKSREQIKELLKVSKKQRSHFQSQLRRLSPQLNAYDMTPPISDFSSEDENNASPLSVTSPYPTYDYPIGHGSGASSCESDSDNAAIGSEDVEALVEDLLRYPDVQVVLKKLESNVPK